MVDVAGMRLEHHALGAHVDTLRTVADGVGVFDADTTLAGVDNLMEFLNHHLLPHAKAEEAVLYPLIDQLMGAADATATMRRDHTEIIRLTEELAALREALRAGRAPVSIERDLRRTLYGLHVLVTLHLTKEDEIYVPLLESRLDVAAAESLTQRMQDATQAAD